MAPRQQRRAGCSPETQAAVKSPKEENGGQRRKEEKWVIREMWRAGEEGGKAVPGVGWDLVADVNYVTLGVQLCGANDAWSLGNQRQYCKARESRGRRQACVKATRYHQRIRRGRCQGPREDTCDSIPSFSSPLPPKSRELQDSVLGQRGWRRAGSADGAAAPRLQCGQAGAFSRSVCRAAVQPDPEMDPIDEKKLRALQMLQPPGLGKGRALLATLRTLMLFTAAMITLPICLYFVSKTYLFEGMLGLPAIDSYFYSAIVAVVSVHIVLALFVYMAWNEGTRQWQEASKLE
uniref:Uncharacterized protein LOC110203585 n=1 Tax=Phascolarctos cinereus TaxID=38626 RepID=A0A6P5JNJ7_PHACI|nr:uncharacterized protein LOC110203585 [Phascolarctos cinereus]